MSERKKIKTHWRPTTEFRFWLYDPEGDGMVFFRSAEDRDAYATEAIDAYLDGEWSEEVEGVCAGEVTHIATQTDREDRQGELDEDGLDEAGEWWPSSDIEYRCNYKLLPLQTPAEKVEALPLMARRDWADRAWFGPDDVYVAADASGGIVVGPTDYKTATLASDARRPCTVFRIATHDEHGLPVVPREPWMDDCRFLFRYEETDDWLHCENYCPSEPGTQWRRIEDFNGRWW